MGGVENYKKFSAKLVKRLLLPYFIAEILFYPIWFVICHEAGHLPHMWDWTLQEPLKSFLVIFVGNGNSQGLILGQLWFLPALFFAEIIFIRLYNRLNKIGGEVFICAIMFCSLLGLLIGKIHDLPLGIDIALAAQIFLLAGVLIRKYNVIERLNLKICILLILTVVVAFCLNVFVDMNSRRYGDPFLFYAGGLAGTLLVMKISALMTGGKIFSLISDCGRQSMVILVLHPIVANIFYEIIVGGFNFPAEKIFTEPAVIFGATAAGVLIPLFIAKKFGKLPVLKIFCP
ncbi:MAG: acyltransferase family protein [Quinella sp. 3Q1]|nr:acyltransferase family protein [Quinella sp. 3Q1]